MSELYWFLLPLAVIVGWITAMWQRRRRCAESAARLPADYLKGLNYILNEQPDKAIEVFIRVLEVDADTIETHFTLGNLFRRRGEVDRAIHIHQNLIARPNLSGRQRAEALLALGEDYMRAGLFDRAENLFLELVGLNIHAETALRYLLDIYQQEKDWARAIEMAERLASVVGRSQGTLIAHYLCEQAEEAETKGDGAAVERLLGEALRRDPGSVRATLMAGRRAAAAGEWAAARDILQRVESRAPAFLPLALAPLAQAHERLGDLDGYGDYLRGVLERHAGGAVMLALAEQIRRREGERACEAFIIEQLRHHPTVRGLDRLVGLHLEHSEGATRDRLSTLKELTRRLMEERPTFQCGHCGFSGKTMHWQCPSCKKWNSVKPQDDLAGG